MAGSGNATLHRELQEQLARCQWPPPRQSIDEDSQTCSEYRQFVNMPALVDWMTTVAPGHLQNNISRLCAVMDIKLGDFRTSCLLRDHDQSCLHILACLLSFEAANILTIITELGNIFDKTMDHSIPDFRYRLIKQEAPRYWELVKKFIDCRWSFKPKHLDADFNVESTYDLGGRIMPFCARQAVNQKGGTAVVYCVHVPVRFISPHIKQHLAAPFRFSDFGECYELAIKTFSRDQYLTFEREKHAFRGLRDQEGIIRCFGSYTSTVRDERTGVTGDSFNLVLEYSSMDLDEMYEKIAAPRFADAIISSWEMIFEVSKAISNIHRLKTSSGEYFGWHGDVKPDNILVVLEQDRQRLKLADFGFTKFRERTESDATATIIMPGGTKAFGPPESESEKDQSIDIWSYGCVLSVHASWILGGREAVNKFKRYREQIYTRQTRAEEPSSAFHDGYRVLPEILDWHQWLLGQGKCVSDNITPKVLQLVENRLLQPKEHRVTAERLCVELDTIISTARAELAGVPSFQILSPEFRVALRDAENQDRTYLSSAMTQLRESVGRPIDDGITSVRDRVRTLETAGSERERGLQPYPSRSTLSTSSHGEATLAIPRTPDRSHGCINSDIRTPSSSAGSSARPELITPTTTQPRSYADARALIWRVVNSEDTTTTSSEFQSVFSNHSEIATERDENLRTPAMVMLATRLPLRTPRNLEILKLLVGVSGIASKDNEDDNIIHHLARSLERIQPPLREGSLSHELLSLFINQPGLSDIVNAPNSDKDQPLHIATKAKELGIVKLLCNLKARPHKEHLLLAIEKRSVDIVSFYVKDHGIKLEQDEDFSPTNWDSWDVPIVRILEQNGIRCVFKRSIFRAR